MVPFPNFSRPHDYDHSHGSVASGWLRASVFGAMDGLVSNIGLIAGIAAAGASPHIVTITGVSGLIAGAISMALGEFASVRTQNEQLDSEISTERNALQRNPDGELAELTALFEQFGVSQATARAAAADIHQDHEQAIRIHLVHELGLSLDERPSPVLAALSSFLFFSLGAIVPLLPYLFGFGSLAMGLSFGAAGLLLAGASAAVFTKRPWWKGALRQLVFGGIAVTATYTIGTLLGVSHLG